MKGLANMALFNKADILLPNVSDMTKWSVIACDQYTSQPEYWKRTEQITAGAPSSLNLIFPEAYLDQGRDRIEKINAAMKDYLDRGIFKEYKNSLIYIERIIGGRMRQGLVGAVDLEEYDFHKGSKSKIRATEGTVLERIPPRVEIRRDAPLELPHVMLLVDDKECNIIEPLILSDKTQVYDFDLMQGGGHLTGWILAEDTADSVLERINKLESRADDGLVFAVGDGNHSLATAKVCWEERKKTLTAEQQETDPARFCLVELVNIHSEALVFEPIHRVVFDCNAKALVSKLEKQFNATNFDNGGQHIHYLFDECEGDLYIREAPSKLAVGTLQSFLDSEGVKVDYIHGEAVCRELGQKPGNVGFLLPRLDKSELFASVIQDGALPRKTFSMGEASEKRYYTEAKKIR